jgi:tRNA splicing endonuclease
MILLYASADVVLARIFEPVMLLIARLAHAVRKEAVLLANGS